MKVRTKTALGIDWGESRLGVALVEKGAHGLRTVAAATANLPAGPGRPEPVPGKVLSRLLGQLGRRTRLRGTPAAIAVSMDPLVMRLFDLPTPLPANVGEFVRGQLQQYVALSGRNVVSDFCGVGSGVQKRLLAAAADAGQVAELVRACSALGIVVEVVEPSLAACARVLRERWGAAAHDGDVLLALLGSRVLTVCLFHRGVPDFVRVRDLPAEAGAPAVLCPWLAEEFKAVRRYSETQVSPGRRTPHVWVVVHDGVHRAGEISLQFAAETGAEAPTVVDAYEPWSGTQASEEELSLVAAGAARTLLEQPEDDLRINLLPAVVTEARSHSRRLLLTAHVCVLAFIGVFLVSQFLIRTTGAMDRKIEQARLAGQLYTAPALIAEEKYLNEEIARLRRQADPLRKALNGRQTRDWPGILRAVREAAPAGVSVAQWECRDGRTLSLQGIAPSCPAAEALVRKLEEQPPFAAVTLAFLQRARDETGPLDYRMNCVLTTKGGQLP